MVAVPAALEDEGLGHAANVAAAAARGGCPPGSGLASGICGDRVISVSNRLPFRLGPGGVPARSAGGLVSALDGVREGRDLVWIGWSGAAPPERTPAADAAERAAVAAACAAGCGCRPVLLDAAEADGAYRGLSNASLWPLLHADLALLRFEPAWWDAYAAVNARFADAVAAAAAPGDRVWVHDYHLMLLPALLRERRPDLRVGFFLHTPFPPAGVFARHPRRERLLRGVLGADLVGFQTRGHLAGFQDAVHRFTGRRVDAGGVHHAGATTRLGVFPIGIHGPGFERGLAHPATADHAASLAAAHAGRRLVLAVERLDPTKGIPQKLDAVEAFLRDHPRRRGSVDFTLVAVPSREDAAAYRRLRAEVERRVGQINGRFSTPTHTPVRLICRGVGFHELCALYRVADACLVTPLADGMNLVAKEYVACQDADPGVLVLSEFAGAADELKDALIVNPHDPDAVADAIAEALDRPEARRRADLAPMRAGVLAKHSGPWAAGFLAALDAAAAPRSPQNPRPPRNLRLPRPPRPPARTRGLADADLRPFAAAAPGRKALLLDYDGTLRGFEDEPDRATPGPALRSLLRGLAGRDDLDVAVVSGRGMGFLRRHLGSLGLTLVAEHGHALCEPGGEPRPLRPGADPGGNPGGDPGAGSEAGWGAAVAATMDRFARETPGAHVERKAAGLVWHHRRADPASGRRRARALAACLRSAGLPVVVTRGHGIVEVTAEGVDKGHAVGHLLAAADRPHAAILCVGDDRTDEAMFRRLAGDPRAVTVKVGPGETAARFRVPGVGGVLAALRAVAGPPAAALAAV